MFTWDDVWTTQSGEFFSRDRYYVPCMAETALAMPGVIAFYGILTWYFDQAIEKNRGVAQPWYFPIMPTYWFPFLASKTIMNDVDAKPSTGKDLTTAEIERNAILKAEGTKDKFVDGVRALGLSKTYKSLSGEGDNEALNNAFFEVKSGQLLGVMGHNGAGKSTMINALCGLIGKNKGTARMLGFNIDENLRSIRKRMGVVSQFDVLWDELTGTEHMILFNTLKRVEMENFDEFVQQRLEDVGLRDSGNLMVGKYSGGMRRRISLALSTMGNPSIILMDEPTTGMDPVSRRHAWSLI